MKSTSPLLTRVVRALLNVALLDAWESLEEAVLVLLYAGGPAGNAGTCEDAIGSYVPISALPSAITDGCGGMTAFDPTVFEPATCLLPWHPILQLLGLLLAIAMCGF